MKNIKLKWIFILCVITIVIGVLIWSVNKFQKINSYRSSEEERKMSNAEEDINKEDSTDNLESNIITNNSGNIENEMKNGTDIFSNYCDKAEQLLNNMTLEEKVGQMFLARYPGTSKAVSEIKSGNPGGYVLFGVDFKTKTKEQVIKEINNDQENSKINLFIAVDEEGGTVTRVSSYTNFRASKFKSPQALYNDGGLEAIVNDSKEKSSLLKSLGINMNLCPVVDIPTSSSSFIYARSFGKGAEETSKYASEVIKQMNNDGIIASMKHFPGYGDNVDTHTGVAIDNREYKSFTDGDFLPFVRGINERCPTILVNHNIVRCMDADKPASLSSNVHKILRDELGFSGLIITDDLAMDAVKSYVANGEAAVQAVLAGNDMIISSNFKTQKEEIIRAVNSGKISEETINNAVRRILACKYYYGIIK